MMPGLMTAFEATQGYSDQYAVEPDLFHWTADRTGLVQDVRHSPVAPSCSSPIIITTYFKGQSEMPG